MMAESHGPAIVVLGTKNKQILTSVLRKKVTPVLRLHTRFTPDAFTPDASNGQSIAATSLSEVCHRSLPVTFEAGMRTNSCPTLVPDERKVNITFTISPAICGASGETTAPEVR